MVIGSLNEEGKVAEAAEGADVVFSTVGFLWGVYFILFYFTDIIVSWWMVFFFTFP